MAEIAFADLAFGYGRRNALDGVSATIGSGERCAVVGPNGSGKTTLLRLLAGILRPSAGEVHLGGEPAAGFSRRAWARRAAYVPQEEHWDFPFTVEEVVRCGRFAYATGLYREDPGVGEAVREALAATGMTELGGRAITELSGGERRRTVLARALAQRAPILLLDEPTTALDLEHRHAIFEGIRALPSTLLLATHDLDAAASCDRILMLASGRIVADGTPAEVLTESRLKEVFHVDAKVLEDGGRIHVVAEV